MQCILGQKAIKQQPVLHTVRTCHVTTTVEVAKCIPCFLNCTVIAPCKVQVEIPGKSHVSRMVCAWSKKKQEVPTVHPLLGESLWKSTFALFGLSHEKIHNLGLLLQKPEKHLAGLNAAEF